MSTFVRVKDSDTGHEYDLPDTDWRIRDGIVTPVKADRYPPAKTPRRTKSRKPLGTKSAESTAGQPAPTTSETGEKEKED